MKYFLLLVIFTASCQNQRSGASPEAGQIDYSTLTKENAEERLKALRISIKDSGLAIITDANLAIQAAKFKLQQNDSSGTRSGLADSVLVNDIAGQVLYSCMQRAYQLSLAHATRQTDINYYNAQLLIPEKQWLSKTFSGKKTFEGLIALHKLQKDMLIVSMVVNDADSDERRRQADEQYSMLEELMKK